MRFAISLIVAFAAAASCATASAASGQLAVRGSWQNDCHYEQSAAALPQCSPSSELLVGRDNGRGPVRVLANCPFSYTVVPCQLGVPAFSPDGRRLAASRDGHLVIFDVRSGSQTALTVSSGIDRPAWSPDGRRIAAVDAQGISVARPDGSGLVRVAPAGATAPQWFRQNGRLRLAYVAPGLSLAVTNAVGHDTRTLVAAGRVASFATSRSGRIVYADPRVVYINHRPTFGRVLTIAPEASKAHLVSRVRPSVGQPSALSLSLSGHELLYTTTLAQGKAVRALTLPHGKLRTLYRTQATNSGPAGTWSPDGRYATIADAQRIVRVAARGGPVKLVLSGENGQPYVDNQTGGLSLSAPSWTTSSGTTG